MTLEDLNEIEKSLSEEFKEVDKMVQHNCNKVISAFWEERVDETFFNTSTGYGYGDKGRDGIERIFSKVLGTEDALVRIQFVSGTHAVSTALFAMLRPGDTMLAISGTPYDTMHEVIGLRENPSSLKAHGVKYLQTDLINDDTFDEENIIKILKEQKIKLIEIQRSRGYSLRNALSVQKINDIIEKIRAVDKDVIIMLDNCYGALTDYEEPKADILVGSLIKNLGAGIAPTGAYIAGKKELIELCADRLAAPGLGKEGGASLGYNKSLLQGIYMAPRVVGDSIKHCILVAKTMEKLGYTVVPRYNGKRADIVQTIIFNDEDKLIKFCQGVQKGSAVDSNVVPMPWDMPGYEHQIVMASGAFVSGSSVEISCDAPIRPPYAAFIQGGLVYEYSKIAFIEALKSIGELK